MYLSCHRMLHFIISLVSRFWQFFRVAADMAPTNETMRSSCQALDQHILLPSVELYLVSYSNPTCSPNPFIEQREQLGNVKKTALPHLCLVCNVHFLNDVTAMRTIV